MHTEVRGEGKWKEMHSCSVGQLSVSRWDWSFVNVCLFCKVFYVWEKSQPDRQRHMIRCFKTVCSSSEKHNHTWILKLYLLLDTGSFATSRNNFVNTTEFWIFWRKVIQIFCKRLASLGIFSLLLWDWLWRCSFCSSPENVQAETEGGWCGAKVSKGYF